jgi:cytochrome bd-type quinol oxidase subunit 1
MHYPFWYVPFLTSPMLIAIIAILHVLVSHYAVGGGFFLAVETQHAYRTRNEAYLQYLRQHAWFFVLITVVYGAITGVGIWWTIGLASPLATETLIHTFVFGWAMEYVVFVLEIASAYIFLYYWGRLDQRTHVAIGWIYAISAWISLVIITCITAFMLNPGAWVRNHAFWSGMLNPQAVPQILARTGGSFLLASLYVYLHASFKVPISDLRSYIGARSARPALLGAVLVTLGGIGWLVMLPDSSRAALMTASVLNVLTVLIFAMTVAVFAMLYLGPYRNPGWVSPGFAILVLGAGMAATTTGEYLREAVRKPYIIYNVVFSNQILPAEVPHLRTVGYLNGGVWTRAYLAIRPETPRGPVGSALATSMPAPANDREARGAAVFQYHCASCHATTIGYSPVGQLLRGWTPRMIRDVASQPEKVHFFMPPFAGTPEDSEDLALYLMRMRLPHPKGMYYGGPDLRSARLLR